MALKDINMDSNGEAIILDRNITTDTHSDDNCFWRLRNTIIKVFVRKEEFWNKFKGTLIKNEIEFEKKIKKAMEIELDNKYPDEKELEFLGIEVLVIDRKAVIFTYKKNMFSKPKKLIDFNIVL